MPLPFVYALFVCPENRGNMTDQLTREAEFGDVISEEERTIEVSISSEYPVKRWDGEEILDHTKAAIDLSRFPLPLLNTHDRWELNIGLIEDPVIKDKKLRGVMRFGEREQALDIWKDVRTKIIRGISIGYERMDLTDVDKGQYHVTRWMPFETSLCSVPADPTVGVGRAKDMIEFENIFENVIKSISTDEERQKFFEKLNEIAERYKTKELEEPAESDDPAENKEPTLKQIERNLKLKKMEMDQ